MKLYRMAGVTLVLALMVSMSLSKEGPALEAQASTRHKHYTGDKGTSSKKAMKELRIAEKIVLKSRNGGWKKGNASLTLNYKKMNKHDGGHVTIRRNIAAVWRDGGGHLSHISKVERRRVNALRKLPPATCTACLAVAHPNAPAPGEAPCTGKRKIKHDTRGVPLVITYDNWDIWADSCQTDLIVLYSGKACNALTIAAVMMALSEVGIGPALLVGLGSIIFSMAQDEVSYWQSRSPYDATRWKVRYTFYTRLYPQT